MLVVTLHDLSLKPEPAGPRLFLFTTEGVWASTAAEVVAQRRARDLVQSTPRHLGAASWQMSVSQTGALVVDFPFGFPGLGKIGRADGEAMAIFARCALVPLARNQRISFFLEGKDRPRSTIVNTCIWDEDERGGHNLR